jgi:hypothetical protein
MSLAPSWPTGGSVWRPTGGQKNDMQAPVLSSPSAWLFISLSRRRLPSKPACGSASRAEYGVCGALRIAGGWMAIWRSGLRPVWLQVIPPRPLKVIHTHSRLLSSASKLRIAHRSPSAHQIGCDAACEFPDSPPAAPRRLVVIGEGVQKGH